MNFSYAFLFHPVRKVVVPVITATGSCNFFLHTARSAVIASISSQSRYLSNRSVNKPPQQQCFCSSQGAHHFPLFCAIRLLRMPAVGYKAYGSKTTSRGKSPRRTRRDHPRDIVKFREHIRYSPPRVSDFIRTDARFGPTFAKRRASETLVLPRPAAL